MRITSIATLCSSAGASPRTSAARLHHLRPAQSPTPAEKSSTSTAACIFAGFEGLAMNALAGSANPPFALRMESISKRFRGVSALDDVSFDLKIGEVLAL